MRTTFVSTLSLWNSSKSSLDKLQTNLVKANKELVSGREADVGLKLGYKTGHTLSLRQDRAELEALTDSNASVLLRLKSTTTTLDQIRTTADKFMDALIATPLSSSSTATLKYQAEANLNSLISSLNIGVAGQYIFGGVNTQQKPLNFYSSATEAAVPASVSIPVSGLTAGDQIRFRVGGGDEQVFNIVSETTVDDLIASINTDETLIGVEARKDSITGHLVLVSKDKTGNTDVTGAFVDANGTGTSIPGIVTRSPKAAVASAFMSTFKFAQDSTLVSSITADDMKSFLNGPFAQLFEEENWKDWSNASNQNMQSRISTKEKVESSANANDAAIQKLAMAYTMIADLGIDRLGEDAAKVLVDEAIKTFSDSITGLTTMQANLGTAQEKVEQANDSMSLQKDILDEKITHFEAVDPAEAKIRIDQLMTQIQMSYSLTAQLRNLSLINFI